MENLSALLQEAVSTISVLAIVFGGVVPFVPQFFKIRKTRNCDGFSTYVILVLMLAYILRILFWIGHPFEMPILLQCFFMLASLLALQYVCVDAIAFAAPLPIRLSAMKWREVWRWTVFSDYVIFLCAFVVGYAVLMQVLSFSPFVVEATGLLSVLLEAMLGVPQLLENWRNRSVQGMSVTMVVCWLSGDIFKTVYYIVREAPIQFPLCGSMQIVIDIALLLQVGWYSCWRVEKTRHHKVPRTFSPLTVKVEP